MDKQEDNQSGFQCFWSDLSEHPKCIHGPTLLFGQYIDKECKKFYICAACRHRKLCPFYLDYGESLTKAQESKWAEKTKQYVSTYHRQKLFIDLHKVLAAHPSRRCYCHNCEKLFLAEDKSNHESHEVVEGLSDHQMSHPTEVLKPATDCKKEAQYLFSNKSTVDLVNFLSKFGAEQVLCIGAPRLHEYIMSKMEGKMSSLLLDLDGRFHNFYGSLNFCWYNLFNHHFFYNDSQSIFKDFLTQNNGKNLYIVCDPPFGGRVEAIAQTLKTISDKYQRWNKLDHEPPIFFIFPYFMEPIMRHKSSPPSVPGGLKDYRMVEYQVEYDNHPMFVRTENKVKLGSPVRIFTNIPLNKFELPGDAYKFCKLCDRWVTLANKHCKKCNDCTSRDGRSYKHCDVCERCVKDFWIHCKDCDRCNMVEHKCGKVPVVHGSCNKCGQTGHTEQYCGTDFGVKRKMDGGGEVVKKKRKKNRRDIGENKGEGGNMKRQSENEIISGKMKKKNTKGVNAEDSKKNDGESKEGSLKRKNEDESIIVKKKRRRNKKGINAADLEKNDSESKEGNLKRKTEDESAADSSKTNDGESKEGNLKRKNEESTIVKKKRRRNKKRLNSADSKTNDIESIEVNLKRKSEEESSIAKKKRRKNKKEIQIIDNSNTADNMKKNDNENKEINAKSKNEDESSIAKKKRRKNKKGIQIIDNSKKNDSENKEVNVKSKNEDERSIVKKKRRKNKKVMKVQDSKQNGNKNKEVNLKKKKNKKRKQVVNIQTDITESETKMKIGSKVKESETFVGEESKDAKAKKNIPNNDVAIEKTVEKPMNNKVNFEAGKKKKKKVKNVVAAGITDRKPNKKTAKKGNNSLFLKNKKNKNKKVAKMRKMSS